MDPTYWCDLIRSHDVIDHMTTQLAIYYFLLVSHWIRASVFNRFNIFASAYISVSRPWPFKVTWRDSPGAISCRCSIVIECVSSHFRDNGPQTYSGHEFDLSASRNVIGYVTNRSAICNFLLVNHWNLISVFNRFQDIYIQIYLGHDLDLTRSRDVIGQVTIWFARCHFLQVLYCNRVSISSDFRDNVPPLILYDTIVEFNVDRKLSIQLYLAHVARKKN